MNRKKVTGIMLTLLLIGMLTLAFNIQPVKASGTIYIRADGSVEGTDKIQRDGNIYTFTENIYGEIVVERNSIVIDGADYALWWGGTGILLSDRSNITIRNIEIKEFDWGIMLDNSSNNNIYGNNITASNLAGIRGFDGSSNNVTDNVITNNMGSGIGFYGGSHHVIDGNMVANNWGGIESGASNYTIISNNHVVKCWNGIWVSESAFATVSNNVVDEITQFGIGMGIGLRANNSTVTDNVVSSSDMGISLLYSNNNTLVGNRISSNHIGVRLLNSTNNRIFHNNLVNNSRQVYDMSWEDSSIPPSVNTWDDSYPSGGNYWSDYEEKYPEAKERDGSGIWDIPYFIDENNQDNFPLMEPWSPKPLSPVEATQELIETIETWNLSKGIENSLTCKLDTVVLLLVKENIRGSIHKLVVLTNQVEALRGKKLTTEQADYLTAEAQRIIDLIKG